MPKDLGAKSWKSFQTDFFLALTMIAAQQYAIWSNSCLKTQNTR